MPKYTAISHMLNADRSYLNSILDGTRYKLMNMRGEYYAMTYGNTKNKTTLHEEIEGELASIGAFTIRTEIYWEVPPFGI